MGTIFNFNNISSEFIQIYGIITGFAKKHTEHNRTYYSFEISFFKGSDLHKIRTNVNNQTICNEDQLKQAILKRYYES